jgi:hypothetical protein
MIKTFLQWFTTIISVASFFMYLFDKAKWRRFKKVSSRTLIFLTIIFAFISIILAVTTTITDKRKNGEVFSREQEQAAETVVGDMVLKFGTINNELSNLKVLDETWHAAQNKMKNLENDKQEISHDFAQYLQYRIKEIDKIDITTRPPDNVISLLKNTKMPIRDIYAFYDTGYSATIDDFRSIYTNMSDQGDFLLKSDWLNKAFELEIEITRKSTEGMYYGLLELVAEMPKKGFNEFYATFAPSFTEFPDTKSLTVDEARNLGEKAFKKCDELINQLSTTIGSKNIDIELLQQDVDRVKVKQEILGTLKSELSSRKVEVGIIQDSLREKCKINISDDQWLMWGKIIKLASAEMYIDVQSSLDEYLRYNMLKDKNADVYVQKAKLYYALLSDLKLENKNALEDLEIMHIGVIVVAFENDVAHSSVKIGDIILKQNEKIIHTNNDLKSANGNTQELLILRFNQQGTYSFLNIKTVKNDPKIGTCNLRE